MHFDVIEHALRVNSQTLIAPYGKSLKESSSLMIQQVHRSSIHFNSKLTGLFRPLRLRGGVLQHLSRQVTLTRHCM